MYKPIGYYLSCDDAVCDDCAPKGFREGDYSEWLGFEDWTEPIPIMQDDECDTPTHCVDCRELIPHALTSHGYAYVLEAVGSLQGDTEVLQAWSERYFDSEYVVEVPKQYREPSEEPTIVISIAAGGGGTLGKAYTYTSWSYTVESNGRELIAGDDLRSNGTPATHAEMARTLCSFLGAAAESLTYRGDQSEYAKDYDRDARDFLITQQERFALMSMEPEEVLA